MSWLPKQTIVVPVDFSDQSFQAVELALGMVEEPEDVHVSHVLDSLAYMGACSAEDDKARKQHAIQRLRECLADAKADTVTVHIEMGDPAHTIAKFAETLEADLIVMPSHGRTGVRRLLIGSVAERVVRLAHCPVLVLLLKKPS